MFIEQSQYAQPEPYSTNPPSKIHELDQFHPQPTIVHSQVYPSLLIISNHHRQFICQHTIPPKCKPIRINDPRIGSFFAAISKLFVQIADCFNIKDLWVCEKEATMYPISAYFTGPAKYPAMLCCQKVVYIKFQYELSGSVRCSKCHKVAFSFVHVPKQPIKSKKGKQNLPQSGQQKKSQHTKSKQGQIHKQNNYVNEKIPNIRTQNSQIHEILKQHKKQKQNQRIYKQQKMTEQNIKINIRKLISSNQHRYKSLKKVLNLNGCNIVEIRSSMNDQYDDSDMKNNNKNNIQQVILNNLATNLGEFIIQIESSKENNGLPTLPNNFNSQSLQGGNWNSIHRNAQVSQKQSQDKTKLTNNLKNKQKDNGCTQNSVLSQNYQEIKNIIQQIFA